MQSVPSCFLLHPFSFLLFLLPNWQTGKQRMGSHLSAWTLHSAQVSNLGLGRWAAWWSALRQCSWKRLCLRRGVSSSLCPLLPEWPEAWTETPRSRQYLPLPQGLNSSLEVRMESTGSPILRKPSVWHLSPVAVWVSEGLTGCFIHPDAPPSKKGKEGLGLALDKAAVC